MENVIEMHGWLIRELERTYRECLAVGWTHDELEEIMRQALAEAAANESEGGAA